MTTLEERKAIEETPITSQEVNDIMKLLLLNRFPLTPQLYVMCKAIKYYRDKTIVPEDKVLALIDKQTLFNEVQADINLQGNAETIIHPEDNEKLKNKQNANATTNDKETGN